jgi:hypothetical protein
LFEKKVPPIALLQQWMRDLFRDEWDFPKVAVRRKENIQI